MTIGAHPTYGTCTGCTQAKRVDKYGRIRQHTYAATSGGILFTLTCPGSGLPYAEQNRTQWNARLSRWQDMPIEITATLHADGKDEPFLVEAHAFAPAPAGYKVFVDNSMSLHLHLLERNAYANLYRAELHDAHGVIVKSEKVRDDGHLNGLALKWMQILGEGAGAVTS